MTFRNGPEEGTRAARAHGEVAESSDLVLEVMDLEVGFESPSGLARVVRGVSFEVQAGETLAIVGESGSGKSVTAQAVMGLLPIPPARVSVSALRYRGEDLTAMSTTDRRRLCGVGIAMVFQDSLAALDPLFRVGWQIAEGLRVRKGMGRREAAEFAISALDRVGIPMARARAASYPHEFSGGMRQRAMIAMAMSLGPGLLIADEPTTALDVSIQAQILRLLKQVQADTGMGMILITHDLGVVDELADRVMVMYGGQAVEYSPTRELFGAPKHPYTAGLIRLCGGIGAKRGELRTIPGRPPDLRALPEGCTFHPRCDLAQPRCRDEEPSLTESSPGRRCACFFSELVTL